MPETESPREIYFLTPGKGEGPLQADADALRAIHQLAQSKRIDTVVLVGRNNYPAVRQWAGNSRTAVKQEDCLGELERGLLGSKYLKYNVIACVSQASPPEVKLIAVRLKFYGFSAEIRERV